MKKTQMTTNEQSSVGASSTWQSMDWKLAEQQVQQLQIRIAKAIKEGRHHKAKALQWLLVHSFYAKALAVKRVTQNAGCKTPGIDDITWRSPKQKRQAINSLQRRGYHAQPLRRIYIPKKNGKQRPLGIPTMKDRAMQALHLLALEPIAETLGDKNSYGFRPKRCTADAIDQCFTVLAKKVSPQWILEADIKTCFDCINHDWLLANIPMDKTILKKWLKAGYQEKGKLFPTEAGAPQGEIISPLLANMALDGLEKTIKSLGKQPDKVHVIRYADDFIITSSSRTLLVDKIMPALEVFLHERGLMLSREKTKITPIQQGFDFLGFNIRKYKEKLLIKPVKNNVKSFLAEIRRILRANRTTQTALLIKILNAKLIGFTNYYRHVVAKQTFNKMGSVIFWQLYRWVRRRHPNKSVAWCRKKYYRSEGGKQSWIFTTKVRNKVGNVYNYDLYRINPVMIKRHIKIRSDANIFDPCFKEYFKNREKHAPLRNCDKGLVAGQL